VAIAYEFEGARLQTAPTSAMALSLCTPVYKEMPTWEKDISTVRKYEDLPQEARDFIELFETELGVPVTRIGVGPSRDQVILR
jgi:adenylosuccinate synthase